MSAAARRAATSRIGRPSVVEGSSVSSSRWAWTLPILEWQGNSQSRRFGMIWTTRWLVVCSSLSTQSRLSSRLIFLNFNSATSQGRKPAKSWMAMHGARSGVCVFKQATSLLGAKIARHRFALVGAFDPVNRVGFAPLPTYRERKRGGQGSQPVCCAWSRSAWGPPPTSPHLPG